MFQIKKNNMTEKRIRKEIVDIYNNPPDGISAGPIDENNIVNWEAVFQVQMTQIIKMELFYLFNYLKIILFLLLEYNLKPQYLGENLFKSC